MKKRIFQWGGVAASVVLMAFGIGTLVIAMQGRSEVQDKLAQEHIVGTPDMTPAQIKTAAQAANLPASIELPTCSVANQSIDTGAEAKCFAAYMRIHALEATGGKTYAELGRYLTPAGKDTNDATLAAEGSEDRRAGRQRRPRHLDHGDRPLDGAEHLVLRRAGRALLDGHGHRAPADRHRLLHPHARWRPRHLHLAEEGGGSRRHKAALRRERRLAGALAASATRPAPHHGEPRPRRGSLLPG